MRNMIKTKNIEGNTYCMFFDSDEKGESRGQYGFSINETEVENVTTDTSLAMSIFDQLAAGVVSPVHLRDICEDMITAEAMI